MAGIDRFQHFNHLLEIRGIASLLIKHRFANLQNLGRQDAKMEGFFVFDYEDTYPDCIDTLADWVRQGVLNPVEHISHGIETMPDALADLYLGNNVGVRMVKVAEPALLS